MRAPVTAALAALVALLAAVAAPARPATGAHDALALVSTAEPAAPATLAVLDGTSPAAAPDAVLLELDSSALSLRLALEPFELVAGIDGRPDAATRAAWRATFGTAAPTAYRGGVPGRPAAWARLLEVDGAWSGHVAADGRLWRIDPVRGAESGGADVDHAVRPVAAIGAMTGAAAGARIGDGAGEVGGAPVLRIGIVVDSRFDERHAGRGLERALAVVNGVDGLFRDALGLGLSIDAVRVHDDPAADPLRDGGDTVESMLETFRLVRDADPVLPADLALVHLFTGLHDARGAFGLGHVDGLCRAEGRATALSTPFAFDMLLAAHEIAHVVGATHDDDPACAGLATESDLMWSTLSGATRASFSACSAAAVERALDSGCLVDGRVAVPR